MLIASVQVIGGLQYHLGSCLALLTTGDSNPPENGHIACRLAGGADLASRMAASPTHTVASPCLGLCEHAPVALM